MNVRKKHYAVTLVKEELSSCMLEDDREGAPEQPVARSILSAWSGRWTAERTETELACVGAGEGVAVPEYPGTSYLAVLSKYLGCPRRSVRENGFDERWL